MICRGWIAIVSAAAIALMFWHALTLQRLASKLERRIPEPVEVEAMRAQIEQLERRLDSLKLHPNHLRLAK